MECADAAHSSKKRRAVRGLMLATIDSKLDDREKLVPIVLLWKDKMPQHILYHAINTLRLTIRLWVEGCAFHVLLNPRALHEVSKEFTGKNGVSI